MNLYKVTITRFVIASDEPSAQSLAIANNNIQDVESVERAETLADIPLSWRDCQPYGGAPGVNVEQALIRQIAANPEYTAFCVQPFKIVKGNAELTSEHDPLAEFGVYARYGNGMAVHLADFLFQMQADLFKRRIERIREMSQTARHVVEDAHLEMQYEDQVSGLFMD
jgi:hypothetical protein